MTSVLVMVPTPLRQMAEHLGMIPGLSKKNVIAANENPPYRDETAKVISQRFPDSHVSAAELLESRRPGQASPD